MNKRNYGLAAAIAFGALLGGNTQASAHHSFAMFDPMKEVVVVGTVREVQWTNPHVWIQVLDEKRTEWSVEVPNGPPGLRRNGWSSKTLKPGDKVTVKIRPLRNGSAGGSLISVTIPGGKVMKG